MRRAQVSSEPPHILRINPDDGAEAAPAEADVPSVPRRVDEPPEPYLPPAPAAELPAALPRVRS